MTVSTPSELKKLKNRQAGLTAKGDQRQYVRHSYTDRSNDHYDENLSENDENTLRLYKDETVRGTFPIKLQIVLKVVEKYGQQHIISWLPHGRSFMIHRPREFEDEVMGKFFKQTKLTSFQRQLNLYDFQRITHGRDAGSYYHELFLRGRPLLSKKMIRRKVKGTKIRASSSPDDEPNFYTLPFVRQFPEHSDLHDDNPIPQDHSIDDTSEGATTNQESRPHVSTVNQPSMPTLPETNVVNDTTGLPVSVRSLNASEAFNQAAALHQLSTSNTSSTLPNSSFLNPAQPSLPYGLYSEMMGAYGTNQLPLSALTIPPIDNQYYSNALTSSALLQREYLSRSLGVSPYDQLGAIAENRTSYLNHGDPSLHNGMGGFMGLQSSAMAAAIREQRIAQLNELAITENNLLNTQLLQRQLQVQRMKNLPPPK